MTDEYEPSHDRQEPCPECTETTGLPVFHPADRPCTIHHLRLPSEL